MSRGYPGPPAGLIRQLELLPNSNWCQRWRERKARWYRDHAGAPPLDQYRYHVEPILRQLPRHGWRSTTASARSPAGISCSALDDRGLDAAQALVGVAVFGPGMPNVRSMSVRDEVAFTPKLLEHSNWQEMTENMLERFGLEHLAKRFPLALSKGQRQRVAYAAVAAASPPILIFDEPTTGIDQPGCDQIMQYMDALRREQKTIVFITHDMPLAMRWADRILVMHDGQLVQSGPPESLATLADAQLETYHLKLPPISRVAYQLGIGHVTSPEELVACLREPVSVCGT